MIGLLLMQISMSVSDMVLAFISALLLYLLIESPFRKIFKELLLPKRDPVKQNAAEETSHHNGVVPVEGCDRNRVHPKVEDSRL